MAWTQADFVACSSPLHVKQFNVEDQCGIRRYDAACTASPVAEFRRDDEGALAADLHGGDAFVPTGDDLPLTDGKLKRLATIDRAVELLALGATFVEPARIVHDADLTGLGRGAGADLAVGNLQA